MSDARGAQLPSRSTSAAPLITAYWGWEKIGNWVTPDYFPVYPSDEQFTQLVRDLNIAMVVVTHNKALAARADRALLLEDGRLQETDVLEVLA